MKHSVIVSSFNRPRMVQTALASIAQQDGEWEAIISDDGSNDETLAVLDRFASDPRFKVLRTDEPRVPPMDFAARAVRRINDAIPHLTGDVVHYLPDDDWFADGRFRAFTGFFKRRPQVDVAYGRMLYANDVHHVHPHGLFPGEVLRDPACRIDHGQFAHRRACFDRVQAWPVAPGNYAIDAVFFHELVAAGYLFHPVDALVSFKRGHPFSLMSTHVNSTDQRE